MKKMLFVFNPRAGKGRIKLKLMDVIDIFTKGGYEVIAYPTQCVEDARRIAAKYAKSVDVVVASGGDGTLDEVVAGLADVGADLPVGYLPAGSTNDFSNSLFFPKTLIEAAEMIVKGEIYCCDVGVFNERRFTYIAAFGLFTDVAYQTDQELKNVLGHAAYLLEGMKRIWDIKSYKMKITKDDGCVIEDDFIYGMITNSRSVGGFKHLTGKNIDMNDGLFEVTLIAKPKNPFELQEILGSLIMLEDESDLIYSFKAKSLMIESEEAVSWTLDGEFGGEHTNVLIENHQEALKIFLTSTKNEEK